MAPFEESIGPGCTCVERRIVRLVLPRGMLLEREHHTMGQRVFVSRTGYTATLTTTKSAIQIVTGDSAAAIAKLAKSLVVKVRSFRMKCTAANGAATYTPAICRVAGQTDVASVHNLARAGVAVAVADQSTAPFDDAAEGAPDELGYIYIAAFPNVAGAVFEFECVLEVCDATDAST